jgi:hypothetical protein
VLLQLWATPKMARFPGAMHNSGGELPRIYLPETV